MSECGNNPEFTCEQEFCNCGKRENTWDSEKTYTEAELQEKLRPYIEAMAEFVERCEKGEVRSRYTYSKFKALIDNNGEEG